MKISALGNHEYVFFTMFWHFSHICMTLNTSLSTIIISALIIYIIKSTGGKMIIQNSPGINYPTSRAEKYLI